MTDYDKTILAIHAHPDDAEIFCAGTMALLVKKGYSLVIASFTSGNLGGFGMTKRETASVRFQEAAKSADILGARFVTLGFDDGFLFDAEKSRRALIDLIREERPGLMFTHLPFDYHADHRAAAQVAEIASMLSTLPNASKIAPLAQTPLLYHTSPLRNRDNLGNPAVTPGFIVDITSVIETKKAMIDCHVSQSEVMRKMHKIEDFTSEMLAQSRMTGRLAGIEYGEAFWQHTGGGFAESPQVQEDLAPLVLRVR